MDLVDLAVQAVDGTKVVASASSRRSYDAEGLARLLERLDRAIAELEDQNEGKPTEPQFFSPRDWPTRGPCAIRCGGRWRNWRIKKAVRIST